MPLVDYDATHYPGIKIDHQGGPDTFWLTARDALNRIVSQPAGRRMLNELSQQAATRGFASWQGAIVKILRPTGLSVTIGKPGEEGGNRSVPVNEITAKNGTGSASAVYWNSSIWVTPVSGQRPPFIGLAHELVHAWHAALGTKKQNYDDEEMFTVGLGQYALADPNSITENKIRVEHNVPIRHRY